MTRRTPIPRGRLLFMVLWLGASAFFMAVALGVIPAASWALAAVALGLCITIAVGVMSQQSGIFATPLNKVQGTGDLLALTFDDGPDPEITPQVLDLLARYNQRATFFVVGQQVERQSELCRRIVAEGHELGNHSMTHAWHMALWSSPRVADDLDRAGQCIFEAIDRRATFFRAPVSVLSPRIAVGTERAGLTLVGYGTRSGDGSTRCSVGYVRRQLERGLKGGNILLLHDTLIEGRAPVSLALLPEILEQMRQRGLFSVPLSELVSNCET